MGVWLNEPILASQDKPVQAVRELARAGYGILRVMLRDTNFTHRSPEVVEAVARMVEAAHAEGVKLVLDCEPHAEPVARDLGSLYPAAIGKRIVCTSAEVIRGRVVAHIPVPDGTIGRTHFLGVEGVFLQERDTFHLLTELPDWEHRIIAEPYANGYSTHSHSYQEGRPMEHRLHVHLSGTISGVAEGRVVLCGAFFDPGVIDFWSKDLRHYYRQVLECYRGISLDGVGWDEPGQGGSWSHYLSGKCFEAAFARRHGYALRERWAWLDADGCGAESVATRLAYYETLNEGIFEAQRDMISIARELFGEDLILGTHHTWQGEGGIKDYRAGAVDYFRLGETMDAGYTDCWWWDSKSVCYAYTLGSSLGRLSPSGEAEINTWDAKPSNSRVEFQSRLMTLFDLTWFNIWYGESTDTALYPADYTWDTTVREMNRHRADLLKIGGARPVVEVAILHGWETVCAVNRADIASAHKTFCLNTAELLLNRNVAFDWLDARLLAASLVSGDRLDNAMGSYSTLILPYASVLPRTAWETCRNFAEAGGKLVFVGPPPETDTEGKSMREEFAAMLGVPVLSLSSYLAEIDAVYSLPDYRSDRIDVSCSLAADTAQCLISVERETHGVCSAAGNVIYLSDLDPKERLLQAIKPWLDDTVIVHSDSILWRRYRQEGREFLVCIAREDREMRGVVRWGSAEAEIIGAKIAFVENGSEGLSVQPGKCAEGIAE